MSSSRSKYVAGAALVVVSLAYAATAAESGRRRTQEHAEAASPVKVVKRHETAAERRQQLNVRMNDMLRSGEGARLSQPVQMRRNAEVREALRTSPAPRAPAPAPALTSTNSSSDDGYRSTIAPPTYTGRGARPAGRGYTAPRLDLVSAPRIPSSDVECLTQAVYYEARNESAEGQAAVAEVVMNRSRSGAYPRSVCAVVYQRNSRTCQFTFTCDGAIGRYPVDMRKWARAERIAREVHEGRSAVLLPTNSVNYHADYVRPSWGQRLERVRQIGAHIFYGAGRGGLTPGASRTVQPVQEAARGLVFVRIDALDRAYQGQTAAQNPEPPSSNQ